MKIISVIGQKGGIGKSTIAGNLGALAAAKYDRVAVADVDPQGTLAKWVARREKNFAQDIAYIEIDITNIKKSIDVIRNSGCEILIIDTLPLVANYMDEIIEASDLVIVPTKASLSDLETLPAVIKRVYRKTNMGFVINEVKNGTNVLNQSIELITNSLKYAGTVMATIPSTVDISQAWGEGKGLLEFNSSNKASVQFTELFKQVEEITSLKKNKIA